LADLEDWYLLDQLRKFRNGQRGWHEQDVEGQVMAKVVQPLAVNDLRNIVAALNDMGKPPSP